MLECRSVGVLELFVKWQVILFLLILLSSRQDKFLILSAFWLFSVSSGKKITEALMCLTKMHYLFCIEFIQ